MHKFRSIASLRPNPRRESRKKYYEKNAEKLNSANSAIYKQQELAKREIPDGLASPAPKLPPVPKVAARQKKKAEREAKRKAKEQAKLLSRGRGRGRGRRGRGRGREGVTKPKIVYSIPKVPGQKAESQKRKPGAQEKRKRARR